VQSGICKVVPLHAIQAFREVEVQLHTHTLNLSTTVNGHEWSASCQATPMLTEQDAGWELELALAIWNKGKSLPLPGYKTMMHQLSNLWPPQYIHYAISALSDTCIH